MKLQHLVLRCALALALASAAGCEEARRIGVLTAPLPPARMLVNTGVTESTGYLNNRRPGESQVDLNGLLNAAVGNQVVKADASDEEMRFALLVDAVGRTQSEVRRKEIRNELISQLVASSDGNCEVYLQSLRGSQVATRTFFDFMTASLGVAGGVAEPLRSAKLLSSLSALSTATGSTVDRDVFAQQGVELVSLEIKKARDVSRGAISTNMSTKSYAEWPLGLALADVARYHGQCSMLNGLTLVSGAVQKRDAELMAARLTAAKVGAAGGSGPQVAAAVAGVTEAALGDIAPEKPTVKPVTDLLPELTLTEASLSVDVDVMNDTAAKCLNKIKANMIADNKALLAGQMDIFKADAANPGKPCVTGAAWDQAFNRSAEAALTAVAADINAAQAQAKDADRLAALAVAFKSASDRMAASAQDLRQDIVYRRQAAVNAALMNARLKATTTVLANDLTAIQTGAPNDPVIAAMVSAAAGFKASPASCEVASAAAFSAAVSSMNGSAEALSKMAVALT